MSPVFRMKSKLMKTAGSSWQHQNTILFGTDRFCKKLGLFGVTDAGGVRAGSPVLASTPGRFAKNQGLKN
jgi:hypothetical protein